MITTVFLYLVATFIRIFASIFTAINFALPDQFRASLVYVISPLKYFRGILDIDTMFQVVGAYLTVLGFLQLIKIGTWAYSHIPLFGGKSSKLPIGGKKLNHINQRNTFMRNWNKSNKTGKF